MKKKYVLMISIIIILLIIFTYLSFIKLKGKKEINILYNEKYKEPGYQSILDVKIKNNIKNKVGSYEIVYQNVLFKIKRKVNVIDNKKPKIVLNYDKVDLLLNEEYKELGFKAIDEYDGDITKNVQIINGINNKQIGVYKVTYSVKDSSNNKTQVTRIVNVIDTLYKDEYENMDNNLIGWYTSNKKDKTRPRENEYKQLKDKNIIFLGEDNKTIYLTFDEGGSKTYVSEIVDILNNNNVKGTFFFCKDYISTNAELMKKIIDTGHSIGNHTVKHLSMPSLATKENFDSYYSEIKQTELAFYQATGKQMEKLFRYPMGEYSNRTIEIMKSFNYKSVFWSAAYKDWDQDYDKEYSLNNMKSQLHNGAIYLIHPKCKGNYEALDEFIKYVKSEGYKIDLVKNI